MQLQLDTADEPPCRLTESLAKRLTKAALVYVRTAVLLLSQKRSELICGLRVPKGPARVKLNCVFIARNISVHRRK